MAGDQTINVLMAGYFSADAARGDAARVRETGANIIGLVVMSKDLEGNVAVEEEDDLVRKGAVSLGGAGFVVGLFAPPLLAATAIGAAIGAGVGKTVQRKVVSGIEQQAEETLPIGGAALIVAYPPESASIVEPTVTRAISRAVGKGRGSRGDALKAAIADAQARMTT